MNTHIFQRGTLMLVLIIILGNWANAQKEFKDKRDKQVYKTIEIGTQTWFGENLRYQRVGAYTNPKHPNKKYGFLYTWKAAMKACPNKWHLPSDEEWKVLESYLGMTEYEYNPIHKSQKQSLNAEGDRLSGKVGKMLKSKTRWVNNQNGIDSIGFAVLPAGLHSNSSSRFRNIGRNAYFWTSTTVNKGSAAFTRTFHTQDGIIRIRESKRYKLAYSVRCVKN